MAENLPLAVKLIAAFLLGAIPFAVLAMKGTGIDVLRTGSCNPGFNNVLRFSKSRAIVTLIGDFGKGMLAVWLLYRPGEDPVLHGWLYGLAAILGHCCSPFLKFKGGKGVATSAGVMLMLYPALTALCLPVYAAVRLTGAKHRWVEAGTIASLGTWALFVLLLFFFQGRQDALGAATVMLFSAWRHKKNFQILFSDWRGRRAGAALTAAADETQG